MSKIYHSSERIAKKEKIFIYFKSGGIHYFHDRLTGVIGYGNTKEEAKNSFFICVDEYYNYQIEKLT